MSLLNSKINSIDAEIINLGGGKADSLFPVFSGTSTFNGPVAFNDPVILGLTSNTVGLGNVQNIDAKAYTDGQIQILTNQAPALLNTITELAAAIGNDPNYVTTISTRLNTVDNNFGSYYTRPQINNICATVHLLPVPANGFSRYDQTVYIGDFIPSSDIGSSLSTDLFLEFASHSYYDNANALEDCIIFLRFKEGSPDTTAHTFYGNGQAYYLGKPPSPLPLLSCRDLVRIQTSTLCTPTSRLL